MLETSACPPPNRGVAAALGKSFRHPLRVGPGCLGLQHAATASSQTSRPGPPRPPQPQCEHGLCTAAGPGLPLCSTDPSMPGLGRGDSDAENLTCSKCPLIPAIKPKSKGKTPTQTDSTCQHSPRNTLVPQWRGLGEGGGLGGGQVAPPPPHLCGTPQAPSVQGRVLGAHLTSLGGRHYWRRERSHHHWLGTPVEQSNDLQTASTAPSIQVTKPVLPNDI